jgi:hypothetical protein
MFAIERQGRKETSKGHEASGLLLILLTLNPENVGDIFL